MKILYRIISTFLLPLFLFLTINLIGQDIDSTVARLERSVAAKDFSTTAVLYKRLYYELSTNEKNPGYLFRAAEYYARANDIPKTLMAFDTAIDAGYTNIYQARSNIAFDFLRSNAKWKELEKKQYRVYKEREGTFYWGLYYGLLTVLFLLNLFLFISGREISYLFFCLLLLADAQWEITQNFSAKVYFVKVIPWMTYFNALRFSFINVVYIFLVILFYVLFSKSFLKLREKLPRMNFAINVTLVFLFVFAILLIFKIEIAEELGEYIVLISFLLCLVSGIVCWKNGAKEARFYVFASLILTISLFLPKYPMLSVYTVLNIGLLLFYLILTIALADKMKIMRLEKEGAQEKALEVLEEKVHERTEEVVKQKYIIEEKQNEMLDSIAYAKRLQEAILPPREFLNKSVPDNFIYYQPKDIVAGDFYWAQKIGNYFYLAAADSTGHGVPGAMVSLVCSNALNRSIKEFNETDTGKILDKTRELVIETFVPKGSHIEKNDSEVKDGMDISLLRVSLLSPEEGKGLRIQWSGAYNPLWFYIGSEFNEIKADKQPIGKHDDPIPFTTHSLTISSPATFYLFTDGYADQFSPSDKKLMTRKFKEILASIQYLSMEEQGRHLESFHNDWKGNMEQTDDVLVIGVRI